MLTEAPEWLIAWARNRTGKRLIENGPSPFGPLPSYLKARPANAHGSVTERAIKGLGLQWTPNDEAALRSALKCIPADDYDIWYRAGMALHQLEWHRGDGTSIAFDIWNDWSASCPEKYSQSGCEAKWSSFGRGSYNGEPITVRSIFRWASERGWAGHTGQNAQAKISPLIVSNDLASPGGSPITNPSSAFGRAAMFSAADLRKMTFDPVRFLVPGFVPDGVTLLVGRPKVGKSWWVLDLCLACSGDRTTLGAIKPRMGDVLYLALEDGKRRLQGRFDKLLPTFNGEWPERLSFVALGGWRRADQGGLEDIDAWCRSVPSPVLVVVDTLERIRKPASGKTPLYSADYEAITGLQKIATEHGISIIVLHHDRKSEADDAFDTVSGTLGLTGAADTILIIKRRSNGVVLYARGRDIEESETAMQFDKGTCRWTIIGAASDVHRSNERAHVVTALKNSGKPLATKEIMFEVGQDNRNAIDVLLYKMAKDGEIERSGRGRYQLPTKEAGQIGQTERLDNKTPNSIEESGNLSNLSDLSTKPIQTRSVTTF